jgi:hypothetical protein
MRHALCALGVASLGLAAAGAAPSDPAERARAILRGGGYQTELPARAIDEPSANLGRRPPAHGKLPPSIHIGGLSTLLLVIIAIALVALGLGFLVRRLTDRTGLERVEPEASTAPSPPERAGPVADAEALARAGRFADAIHALLLAALRELGRRAGSPASSPAATSREVLRSSSLPAEAKAALGPLVSAVESIHFGRAAAGLGEYAGCASAYRQFLRACRLPT